MPAPKSKHAWKPKQDRELDLPKTEITSADGKEVVEMVVYDPLIMAKVCDRIMDGETLTTICVPGSGMPTRRTIERWVALEPAAARALAAAREISAYILEEEALDVARKSWREPGSAQQVRAVESLVNHLRWAATRRNPQVYSEKAAVKITVPIQINTGLSLTPGQPGDGDGVDGNSVYTIEAKLEHVDEAREITAVEAMTADTKPLNVPPSRVVGSPVARPGTKKRYKKRS